MSNQRLGLGLSALINSNATPEQNGTTDIAVDQLSTNPWQPRKNFESESLEELAQSIKKCGLLSPLLVRQLPDKSYQIIAGERRWRAAMMAGLDTVPVFIRQMSDEEVMAAAIIENLQREDLNPIEEALALKALRETLNLTQEALAERIGSSRSRVANALRLLQLDAKTQEEIKSGRISAGHARALLSLPEGEVMDEARELVLKNNLSVRDTEIMVSRWKNTGRFTELGENADNQAPFAQKLQSLNESDEDTPNSKKNLIQKNNELALKMQSLIAEVLNCKTQVRGTEKKGTITIRYSSSEELQHILKTLGGEKLCQQ